MAPCRHPPFGCSPEVVNCSKASIGTVDVELARDDHAREQKHRLTVRYPENISERMTIGERA